MVFFFFKQKTAYEMRISDWSSDVCSSDLVLLQPRLAERQHLLGRGDLAEEGARCLVDADVGRLRRQHHRDQQSVGVDVLQLALGLRQDGGEAVEEGGDVGFFHGPASRSEEHTSELQSLMRISYAVF